MRIDPHTGALRAPRYMLPPTPPLVWPVPCAHPRIKPPAFDEKAAADLGAEEVRRRWPRFEGACPDCGASFIAYASAMHFVMGDW